MLDIKYENGLNFSIEHFEGGSTSLMRLLSNTKSTSFGFVDFPVYLSSLENGSVSIKRHSYISKEHGGKAIALPITSDWSTVFNEYVLSQEFTDEMDGIINNYIPLKFYRMANSFTAGNEIALLNEEKAIQSIKMKLQEKLISQARIEKTGLVSIVAIIVILLAILLKQFLRQKELRLALAEQKSEIESQAEYIKASNDALEMIVIEKTKELQRKNKALEDYAFITAHKLRAPLASILGLVNLFEYITISNEDKILVSSLQVASKKLDDIVHEIIKAVDEEDSLDSGNEV